MTLTFMLLLPLVLNPITPSRTIAMKATIEKASEVKAPMNPAASGSTLWGWTIVIETLEGRLTDEEKSRLARLEEPPK